MNDARYFKHDSNARRDPKIKSLIKKYGLEGYGRFWVVIEMLRESSSYRIPDEEYVWDSLAEDFSCSSEDAKIFIEDCANKFKLLEKDDGYYFSASFLKRMYQLEEIRQKRSAAAKSRWENE